ncbi:MAG: hypothetical protein HOW73_50845 [Polyangiaceae bacterium]|nr:hypothetical protein [Polyangiaceae bacterium]
MSRATTPRRADLRRLGVALIGALCIGVATNAFAGPTSAADDLSRGDVVLRAASGESSPSDKRRKALEALSHFEASFGTEPSWRAAAGASDANLLLGSTAAASGWYWVASDNADYSEAYLAWQTDALARIFDKRATFTFDFNDAAASLRIDDVGIPPAAVDRALAFDVGTHTVLATSQPGNTFQGKLDVTQDQIGKRFFFPVQFARMLKAGEEDPSLPQARGKKQESSGLGPLQIGMIVGTVALASGIAIGGSYLLFGEDNPRGLDTPEGAIIVSVELLVIGAGTAIALLSDG